MRRPIANRRNARPLSDFVVCLLFAAVASGCDASADQTDSHTATDAVVDATSDAEDAVFAPPVACGTALPGAPLAEGVIEAEPGFAEEIAALDLSQAPETVDFGGNGSFTQTLVRFMLGLGEGTTFTRAQALAAGPLGKTLLGAVVIGEGSIDVTFLRRGLYAFYSCTRPLPGSLAEFEARYGDHTMWEESLIDCSRPKRGRRVLWENHVKGIYVAETLNDDQSVRETEIIFSNLRGDGHLDFAAYTQNGELTDRSTFATGGGADVVSAAPYTCLACHVDHDVGRFSELFPVGTGAACD